MQNKKKRLGVYAGSFDPLTIGHAWMIQKGVNLFDRLIVAMGINPEKRYTFSLEQRFGMLRESLKQYRNLSVTSFSNRYLIDYAQSIGATHILRGIRSESDTNTSGQCGTLTATSILELSPCS